MEYEKCDDEDIFWTKEEIEHYQQYLQSLTKSSMNKNTQSSIFIDQQSDMLSDSE